MKRFAPRVCFPWPREWNGGPAKPFGPPTIDVTFDVTTKSETNARDRWGKIHRTERARVAVGRALSFDDDRLVKLVLCPPFCVRLTRISGGTMDTGNLSAALKAIEDAVSFALETDDGDPAFGVCWAQAKRRGPAAVRIEVWGGHARQLPLFAEAAE